MQTFLPHADFARAAAVLDQRRLGKQRVEVLQICRALHLDGYGWAAHPAVTMWRGHTDALVSYGVAVVEAWLSRGFDDTTLRQIAEFAHPRPPRRQADLAPAELPPWLGWPDLHRSHQAALVRKDPQRYRPCFPDVPEDLPYAWPDPPTPPADPGPISGWGLRGRIADGHVVVAGQPGEGPADPPPRRRSKRVRQVERLHRDVTPGTPVVVPDGDQLRLGTVTGPARHVDGDHVVAVRWTGTLRRSALRFPAALQDPQVVIPLHDEPLVAG